MKAINLSAFQMVYECCPWTPLDLVLIPSPTKFPSEAKRRAQEIQDLHTEIRERIKKSNDQAKHHTNKHTKVTYV